MEEYLNDPQYHLIGTVKKEWDNKQVLYNKHHD